MTYDGLHTVFKCRSFQALGLTDERKKVLYFCEQINHLFPSMNRKGSLENIELFLLRIDYIKIESCKPAGYPTLGRNRSMGTGKTRRVGWGVG